jgi:hypothetical protein
MEITAEMFENATGSKPEQDDLERCNCTRTGQHGHMSCGWNHKLNLPVFIAGTGEVYERTLTRPGPRNSAL